MSNVTSQLLALLGFAVVGLLVFLVVAFPLVLVSFWHELTATHADAPLAPFRYKVSAAFAGALRRHRPKADPPDKPSSQ